MATKPTEQAPSFLQVYTQVRRDRMKHSFLRQINACVDWRGIRTLLNKNRATASNFGYTLNILIINISFELNCTQSLLSEKKWILIISSLYFDAVAL